VSKTITDLIRESGATRVPSRREESATHPCVERWIAYRDGELPPEEEKRLQRHLAQCRACVALVLDLEAFSRPETPDRAGISEFEVAAAWRVMRSAIREDLRKQRWHVSTSLAACFLVVTLGLSTWAAMEHHTAAGLRRTVAEFSQPQINVPIHDFLPDTATRGGSPRPVIEMPAAAPFATLVFTPAQRQEYPDYQVTICDAEGTEIWSSRGLEMSPYGTFRLGLPRDFLAVGEHQIRLYGLDGDLKVLIQDWPIEIHP